MRHRSSATARNTSATARPGSARSTSPRWLGHTLARPIRQELLVLEGVVAQQRLGVARPEQPQFAAGHGHDLFEVQAREDAGLGHRFQGRTVSPSR
jgi:hypothetical protein